MQNDKSVKATSEVIKKFLNDYPWQLLVEVLQHIPKIRSKVTRGGVRLNLKNRKLIASALEKVCSDDSELLYLFFVSWFNSNQSYHDLLHVFFQSKEHEKLQEERGVEKSRYVIDDEHFHKLIDIVQDDDIDFFLQLSPIEFSDNQIAKLTDTKGRNNNSKIPNITISANSLTDKKNDKSGNLRNGERKFFNKELQKKEQRIECLQIENKKLREKIDNIKKSADQHLGYIEELRKNYETEINYLSEQKKLLEEKIAYCETEISKIKHLNDNLEKRIIKLKQKLLNIEIENEKPFYDIISKIEFNDLIAGINAPDDVLEVLRTIVKPPSTDETERISKHNVSLPEFWQKLSETENELIQKIFQTSVISIHDGSFSSRWDYKVDEFTDLKCSLSARYFLIDILYGILRQYHNSE